jgi:hypothetical protein
MPMCNLLRARSSPLSRPMKSARSIRSPERSTWRGPRSGRVSYSCSDPAIRSSSKQRRRPASCCSAALLWVGHVTSGGTSCPRGRSGSSKPKKNGLAGASTPSRVTRRSSFRFRNGRKSRGARPEGRSHGAHDTRHPPRSSLSSPDACRKLAKISRASLALQPRSRSVRRAPLQCYAPSRPSARWTQQERLC